MGIHDQSTSPNLKFKHAKDFYNFCQRKLCKIEDSRVETNRKGRDFFLHTSMWETYLSCRHFERLIEVTSTRYVVFAGHIV